MFQSSISDPDMRVSQTHTQTSLVQTPCSPDDGALPYDMNNTLSKAATEVGVTDSVDVRVSVWM